MRAKGMARLARLRVERATARLAKPATRARPAGGPSVEVQRAHQLAVQARAALQPVVPLRVVLRSVARAQVERAQVERAPVVQGAVVRRLAALVEQAPVEQAPVEQVPVEQALVAQALVARERLAEAAAIVVRRSHLSTTPNARSALRRVASTEVWRALVWPPVVQAPGPRASGPATARRTSAPAPNPPPAMLANKISAQNVLTRIRTIASARGTLRTRPGSARHRLLPAWPTSRRSTWGVVPCGLVSIQTFRVSATPAIGAASAAEPSRSYPPLGGCHASEREHES